MVAAEITQTPLQVTVSQNLFKTILNSAGIEALDVLNDFGIADFNFSSQDG